MAGTFHIPRAIAPGLIDLLREPIRPALDPAGGAPRLIRRFGERIPAGESREYREARHRVTLHCNEGSVWITENGDPKDVFIEAGGSHTISRAARTISAHALVNSVVEIQLDCDH